MTPIASHIPPTLDSHEAAEFLKCSVEQVEKLARDGDLPGTKIGKSWVFVGPDLIEWLREQVASNTDATKNPEPKPKHQPGKRSRRKPAPSLAGYE